MATNGDISMISPPTSSISNDQDPFGQLPPLPPPLRSTQVLQPLSVFPGAETIKLHLYSCNCSPVYSLLCLPYLFSSIYCSIERSSNCTIVTSFVFVLLSPLSLSLPSLPVYFHHDFIATLYRCVARWFCLLCLPLYFTLFHMCMFWFEPNHSYTQLHTRLFVFGLYTHQQTHTQTLALSLCLTHSHTANTKFCYLCLAFFSCVAALHPTINQSINRIPLKIIPISQTVVH